MVPLQGEERGARGDGPVLALDDLAGRQRGEEAVHRFLDLELVARDGGVDGSEGFVELLSRVEAGGEAGCVAYVFVRAIERKRNREGV